MPNQTPNFLTCPAFPELEPPKEERKKVEVPEVTEPEKAAAPIEPSAPATLPSQPKEVSPETQKPEKPKKSHARRLIKWFVALCVILLLIATVPSGIWFVRAYFAGYQAKQELTSAKDKISKLDMGGAADQVDAARIQLTAMHDALRNVGFWRDLPGIGVQIRGLEDAATAGADTLDSAHDLLAVAQTVTDAFQGGSAAAGELQTGIAPTRRFQDLTPDEKRDLLANFSAELPKLRLARDKMDMALELWSRVPQDQLFAPLRNALQPLADALPRLKQALDQSVPLLEAFVPLAGYPDKLSYLLLLQNSDELRPGGGFIGNVGTLTLDAGEIGELAFTDVYNIDNPVSGKWHEVPPAPIKERMAMDTWYLRDANWSPDFPTSAVKIMDFYVRERTLAEGKPPADPPDAVLALEPGLFRALLHFTGPVTVQGETFDENNFFDQLQYEVEQGFFKQGVPLDQRKLIVAKIGEALLGKLQTVPAARWPALIDLVTQALTRKQIMAYSTDPDLLVVLDRLGWTARAQTTQDDFLWVVDANLAALKTDGVMNKGVKYQVDATDPQGPTATVTLTYKNTNRTENWRYTRYRSYTRVYVPDGSMLLESFGAMKDDRYRTGGVAVPGKVDVMKDLGKTVFGAFWSIEPGQTGTLMFKYRLPQDIADQAASGTYRLDWPKQAGADNSQLTLDLKFGKNIKSAVPAEAQNKWGDSLYEYQTDSLVDRMFEIKF